MKNIEDSFNDLMQLITGIQDNMNICDGELLSGDDIELLSMRILPALKKIESDLKEIVALVTHNSGHIH